MKQLLSTQNTTALSSSDAERRFAELDQELARMQRGGAPASWYRGRVARHPPALLRFEHTKSPTPDGFIHCKTEIYAAEDLAEPAPAKPRHPLELRVQIVERRPAGDIDLTNDVDPASLPSGVIRGLIDAAVERMRSELGSNFHPMLGAFVEAFVLYELGVWKAPPSSGCCAPPPDESPKP